MSVGNISPHGFAIARPEGEGGSRSDSEQSFARLLTYTLIQTAAEPGHGLQAAATRPAIGTGAIAFGEKPLLVETALSSPLFAPQHRAPERLREALLVAVERLAHRISLVRGGNPASRVAGTSVSPVAIGQNLAGGSAAAATAAGERPLATPKIVATPQTQPAAIAARTATSAAERVEPVRATPRPATGQAAMAGRSDTISVQLVAAESSVRLILRTPRLEDSERSELLRRVAGELTDAGLHNVEIIVHEPGRGVD